MLGQRRILRACSSSTAGCGRSATQIGSAFSTSGDCIVHRPAGFRKARVYIWSP